MRKSCLLVCSLFAVASLCMVLSSCKDDEPYVKPNVSISTDNLTVGEDAGIIELTLTLDKPAPADIIIEYSLAGTATSPDDYGIVGKDGEVIVPQGKNSALIPMEIANDRDHEDDENVEISLTGSNSDNVLITSDNKVTVTISDDDNLTTVSFVNTDLVVNEAYHDDYFRVDILLSKPVTEEVKIQYQITHGEGYAMEGLYREQEGFLPEEEDYYVIGEQYHVVIPPGSTSGEILLNIWSDFKFEEDELIEITLTETSPAIGIGENDVARITLTQENGKIVKLVWDESYVDVDMDLLLYYGEDPSVTPEYYSRSAVIGSVPNYETLIVPSILVDGTVGLCYTYFSGTQSPMNFESQIIDFADGQMAAHIDVYPATYTLDNINVWNEDGEPDVDPIFAQTFQIEAGLYTVTDPIFVADFGSRLATQGKEKKQKGSNSRVLKHP